MKEILEENKGCSIYPATQLWQEQEKKKKVLIPTVYYFHYSSWAATHAHGGSEGRRAHNTACTCIQERVVVGSW